MSDIEREAAVVSRRRFLRRRLAVAGAAYFTENAALFAQKASLKGAEFRASLRLAQITPSSLRNGLSVLTGSGGNIIVLPGKDGKLLVDSGLATSQTQLDAALRSLSHESMRHLLNTHWHFDHTDGNQWTRRAGAEVIAQRNTRERMMSRQIIPAFSAVIDPSPNDALPTVVFDRHLVQRYLPIHRLRQWR